MFNEADSQIQVIRDPSSKLSLTKNQESNYIISEN